MYVVYVYTCAHAYIHAALVCVCMKHVHMCLGWGLPKVGASGRPGMTLQGALIVSLGDPHATPRNSS